MPSETATADLFEIIGTTRSMRLKPDPVPNELIRDIFEAGRLRAQRRKICSAETQERVGATTSVRRRVGCTAVSARRTCAWHQPGPISAAARCGGTSGRAHPRGPGLDRPLPRRRQPDPHVWFVDLSRGAEHVACGESAWPRRASDDAVPELREGSGGRTRIVARRALICVATNRISVGAVRASPPYRARRCRL
jgi:hypothetical protein